VAEDTQGMEFIASFFAGVEDGFLIDVGAYDGIGNGSMSEALLARGWSGLMVEPQKSAYAKLEQAYKDNPRVVCSPVACSEVEGAAMLHPHKGVSTLNDDWAKACDAHWKHVHYGEPYKVKCARLGTLLADMQKEVGFPVDTVDYLQIDTEGSDFDVLRSMNWAFQPRLVCVETLDMCHRERKVRGVWEPDPAMEAYLIGLGYKRAMLTRGGNGIYVRKDVS